MIATAVFEAAVAVSADADNTGAQARAWYGAIELPDRKDLLDDFLRAVKLDRLLSIVVLSHLHFDHAGGATLFPKSELVVQKDEYGYAQYPASFFDSFYYRKNFDLPVHLHTHDTAGGQTASAQ